MENRSVLGLTAAALGACLTCKPAPRRAPTQLRPTFASVVASGSTTSIAEPPPPRANSDGTGQLVLVTGATGKVGTVFLDAYRKACPNGVIRALCNNRTLPPASKLEVVNGSIGDREVCEAAMEGVTHVVHLATVKETPDLVMDVTVKGLFMLLEVARESPTFKQFMLIGGDAGMGHFFYDHGKPVTETQKWTAYPGCYALSKVLEECMLEQYYIQYDLNGCCLMAPWIMEKDDYKYSCSFGDDLFGGPPWKDYVDTATATRIARAGAGSTVPLALDINGKPMQRNFVHVSDLVSCMLLALDHPAAKQQKFNVCMDEPLDYGEMAAYMKASRGIESVECQTEFQSTWLDNSKAKFQLGWRPWFNLPRLLDASWDYQRGSDDARKIWYPG